jgi:hypothetical protein
MAEPTLITGFLCEDGFPESAGMGNIPNRPHKVLSSPYPSDEEVLDRLLTRVKELRAC